MSRPLIRRVMLLILFFGCAPGPVARAADSKSPPDDVVRFEFALYLLSDSKVGLAEQVGGLREKEFADIGIHQPDSDPKGILTIQTRETDVRRYAPPDEQSLGLFGHGLTEKQRKQLQNAPAAWIIDFYSAHSTSIAANRRAAEFMLAIAEKNDALIWDDLTREVFSTEVWRKRRIEGWEHGIPDISSQITIHLYSPDGADIPRAITLGMAKFGCPDVAIEAVPKESSRGCGNLIDVVCQTMIEQGPPRPDDTEVSVDIEKILHKSFARRITSPRYPNATGKAILTIRPAHHDQGDPDNRILDLSFDHAPGKTDLEKMDAVTASVFGSSDQIVPAKHDEELLAARDRAVKRIHGELKTRYLAGLPIGDTLLVKAPFRTDQHGDEWMWVEVTKWSGGKIAGILQNEPFHVPELKSGSRVTVDEADLFDYLLHHADGSTEGNETGEILVRREHLKD